MSASDQKPVDQIGNDIAIGDSLLVNWSLDPSRITYDICKVENIVAHNTVRFNLQSWLKSDQIIGGSGGYFFSSKEIFRLPRNAEEREQFLFLWKLESNL